MDLHLLSMNERMIVWKNENFNLDTVKGLMQLNVKNTLMEQSLMKDLSEWTLILDL